MCIRDRQYTLLLHLDCGEKMTNRDIQWSLTLTSLTDNPIVLMASHLEIFTPTRFFLLLSECSVGSDYRNVKHLIRHVLLTRLILRCRFGSNLIPYESVCIYHRCDKYCLLLIPLILPMTTCSVWVKFKVLSNADLTEGFWSRGNVMKRDWSTSSRSSLCTDQRMPSDDDIAMLLVNLKWCKV